MGGTLKPAMEDARVFTEYLSSSILNEVVKDEYKRNDATSYRYFLQGDQGTSVTADLRSVDTSGLPPRRSGMKKFPKVSMTSE
jgi:hypothetical protein